mmetsp:Transcript_60013/g.143483  ORF Transcript_60013/g.143483 Transcript_60013/m.143483 type:complete len:203 (-) Transcript_60013:1801-2409(-)
MSMSTGRRVGWSISASGAYSIRGAKEYTSSAETRPVRCSSSGVESLTTIGHSVDAMWCFTITDRSTEDVRNAEVNFSTLSVPVALRSHNPCHAMTSTSDTDSGVAFDPLPTPSALRGGARRSAMKRSESSTACLPALITSLSVPEKRLAGPNLLSWLTSTAHCSAGSPASNRCCETVGSVSWMPSPVLASSSSPGCCTNSGS